MADPIKIISLVGALGLVGIGGYMVHRAADGQPVKDLQAGTQPADVEDDTPRVVPGGTTTRPARKLAAPKSDYLWLTDFSNDDLLGNRIPPPPDFERVPVEANGFARWLRCLPLKKGCPPILLFNGSPKPNQTAHVAVVDMDVGGKDLQQCADSCIRLRAEYLFAAGRPDRIRFSTAGGARMEWLKWAQGYRAYLVRGAMRWQQSVQPDNSHAAFRKYLEFVFEYAGTISLSREMKRPGSVNQMRIGDCFVQGGSPGHAVMVVDMAGDKRTGQRVFLLAQGFMPAQEMHILKNPNDPNLSPWYSDAFGDVLVIPEWRFRKEDLRRF